MFRLSNKTVQVIFQDKTEILLSAKNMMVNYLNRNGERNTYPLAAAIENNKSEVAKRLRYTKKILKSMLSSKADNKPDLHIDSEAI